MVGGELSLKAFADGQWPIQASDEYQLGSHQNWNFHRMVSTASDTVSPVPYHQTCIPKNWP
jgi:hypothetical protein